jgi:hypothetical protein
VISADLPALGRVPIGARIAFELVTLEEAQALRRKLYAEMEGIHDCMVPILPDAVHIEPRLRDCNLISGVVDASSWRM